MIKKSLALLAISMLVACGSVPSATLQTEPSPALLASNNSSQCHQELMMRLSEKMGQSVTISANVFSTESRLLLEPLTPRNAHGMHKDGMSLAKPTLFNLLILNQQCLLADEKDQQTHLNLCVCQPLTSN